jgi:uncharacterized protein
MSFKLSIQVKPQARKQSITKIFEQEYQIALHAPPLAGKAKQTVVEFLAKCFSVPKSSLKVLRGQSSRQKLVEIG